jgi:hypothetical protein
MTLRKPVYLPTYVKPRHWLVSAFIWVIQSIGVALYLTVLYWGIYLSQFISGR